MAKEDDGQDKKITQELQSDSQVLWGYRKETAYAIEFSKIYLIQVENEKDNNLYAG